MWKNTKRLGEGGTQAFGTYSLQRYSEMIETISLQNNKEW